MVTVIAVHGTFEKCEGKGWFQTKAPKATAGKDVSWFYSNSDFARGVQSEAGEVNWVTFSWGMGGKGGDNSQRRRDEAGRILYENLKERDAAGEKYVVIGHSHGGNVIASAIRHAATDSHSLPNLRRAIVVGTPLLDVRRRYRLAPTGLIKRLALLLFLIVIIGSAFGGRISAGQAGAMIVVLFAAIGAFTHGYNSYFMPKYAADFFRHFRVGMSDEERAAVIARDERLGRVEQAYDSLGKRWYAFFHTRDEALAQLEKILGLKVSIGAEEPGMANHVARVGAYLFTVVISAFMVALFVLDYIGMNFDGVDALKRLFDYSLTAAGAPKAGAGEAAAFAFVVASLMSIAVAAAYWTARLVAALLTPYLNTRLTMALHDSMLGSDGYGFRAVLRRLDTPKNEDGMAQFGYYIPEEKIDDDLATILVEVGKEVAQFGDPPEQAVLRFKDNAFRFVLPSSGELNAYRFAADAFDAMMRAFDFRHNQYFQSKNFQRLVGKIIHSAKETATQGQFEASLQTAYAEIASRAVEYDTAPARRFDRAASQYASRSR